MGMSWKCILLKDKSKAFILGLDNNKDTAKHPGILTIYTECIATGDITLIIMCSVARIRSNV
eukprot:scaffold475373_cov15-Prasinocladus_malaysianus.AAC.1